MPGERHCQTKFYTASWRSGAGWSPTVFAQESPTRSARFDAENDLYPFALTVPAIVAVDDRRMAERLAVVMDGGGVVGRIHQVVEIGDAGAGHQGNGDLTVVDGSRSKHAGDRDLAAGDIQMQFVADPGFLVALAVFLGADIARGGQIGRIVSGAGSSETRNACAAGSSRTRLRRSVSRCTNASAVLNPSSCCRTASNRTAKPPSSLRLSGLPLEPPPSRFPRLALAWPGQRAPNGFEGRAYVSTNSGFGAERLVIREASAGRKGPDRRRGHYPAKQPRAGRDDEEARGRRQSAGPMRVRAGRSCSGFDSVGTPVEADRSPDLRSGQGRNAPHAVGVFRRPNLTPA